MGRDVGRAAGFYEQCDHRSPFEMGDSPRFDRHVGALLALGLVGRPGLLGHHALRPLAGSDRLSDFDTRSVSIADVLAEVRLDADADLVIWRTVDGSQIATSIVRLLEDSESILILGGADQTKPPQWSAPVIVRSASLPNHEEVEVVALTAMTFARFIGGDR